MTKEEMYQLMNDNPVFHLATIDGGSPRVRAMFLYRAGRDGIVFHTGIFKEVYRQLRDNPRAELCFQNGRGVQVRAAGEVELVEDIALKEEIVAHPSREFLRPWIAENGLAPLAVFRLRGGRATVWTMATNFEPNRYLEL